MAIGTCKSFRQIGGRGSYAFVQLDVEPADLAVDVDVSAIRDEHRFLIPAVRAGIELALTLTLSKRPDAAMLPFHRVKVVEVKYATVDSTEPMFVYAAAMAYFDALRIAIELPFTFNSETDERYFCVPF